jgi:hypothetical protein
LSRHAPIGGMEGRVWLGGSGGSAAVCLHFPSWEWVATRECKGGGPSHRWGWWPQWARPPCPGAKASAVGVGAVRRRGTVPGCVTCPHRERPPYRACSPQSASERLGTAYNADDTRTASPPSCTPKLQQGARRQPAHGPPAPDATTRTLHIPHSVPRKGGWWWRCGRHIRYATGRACSRIQPCAGRPLLKVGVLCARRCFPRPAGS